MEENITAITKLQNEIIIKLQEMDIALIRSVPRRKDEDEGEEMENNNLVTHHLEEEGMSWKTTT